MALPILLVSLASHTCLVRSVPKSISEEWLLGSFAQVQSERNSGLREGLICSRRKRESSPTTCPIGTMASMLAASVFLSVFAFGTTYWSHAFKMPKVAFCKACCMFLTLKSALHL